MVDYKSRCINNNDNEILSSYFHKKTSLSNIDKHKFDFNVSSAFDDINFMNSLNENKNKNRKLSTISLAKPSKNKNLQFFRDRESTRQFVNHRYSFEEFSNLLYYSYSHINFMRLTTPSAGGTYPVELIIIINNVNKLSPGIYSYNPWNFSLERLTEDSFYVDYYNVTSSYSLTENCSFSIHFIGNLENICYKYQDRGYRFLNLECGHIAQNLSLVSEYFKIGAVCSGGFLDGTFLTYLNNFTKINIHTHVYLYEIFFGEKLDKGSYDK
ncbi:SagB/ThcOx family dehydrogenase [Vagococcus fluvialis]|uniref:SagB/ThcOx family dehydrogenase n=1 Tax=Vagococcus fluvialis TaxID=2738 RepID=UPI00143299FD|nr:SagB/ThcOx family dehydrogenase [Vagococcus fluvialis]MBO0488544.1 SagB/ThcOx family dehydrogenase [Vagococcus fluvialis]NKC60946.1 SagB/ThcOx family dehydrogenase [Vagococcus fluvialis]NKD51861.1 SagB/ThcOx family dehydrogenase [Vagococcus fluvialis]